MTIPALGEWYRDLLAVDAWINARSKGMQANSLLSAKLQEREPRLRERIAYLARKRKISPDDLWSQILSGTASEITAEEANEEEGD